MLIELMADKEHAPKLFSHSTIQSTRCYYLVCGKRLCLWMRKHYYVLRLKEFVLGGLITTALRLSVHLLSKH